MNRRSFFSTLLKGAAAFTILPSAGRVWKATRVVPNPLYENVPHEIPWEHLYRAPHFEYLPSFQDFLKTKAWPPNMGETRRIIHAGTSIIPNTPRTLRSFIRIPD